MARPGLTRHRKFARLTWLLGGSKALALGHLELLWAVAYESGDDLVGSDGDAECLAEWQGAPGKLAAALVEAGFLDRTEDGQLRIHDLWDHAPDYVRKRRSREAERRTKGARLRSLGGQRPVSDQSVTGQCPPNGAEREASRTQHPAPTQNRSLRAADADPLAAADESKAYGLNAEAPKVVIHDQLVPDPPPPPPVVVLPCLKGESYAVTESQVVGWSEAYPAVDVRRELLGMREWLEANRTRLKTLRGCPAFIVRWLSKAQDQPRGGPRVARLPGPDPNRGIMRAEASEEQVRQAAEAEAERWLSGGSSG